MCAAPRARSYRSGRTPTCRRRAIHSPPPLRWSAAGSAKSSASGSSRNEGCGHGASLFLAQLAPQAVEPRVAAAARDVELVLQRVLLVVVLVVILGGPEVARRHDRREDRLAERFVLLPFRLGGLGEALRSEERR